MSDPRWQTVRGGIGTAAEYEIGAAENALAALDSLEAEMEHTAKLLDQQDETYYKDRAEKAEAERDAAHVLRDATVKKYLEQRLASEAEVERLREELRWIVEQPTKIFPGNVTAYVPNYVHDRASAALGGEE